MSPLNLSVCDSVSIISDLEQLDGNISVCSDDAVRAKIRGRAQLINSHRANNASVAHHLPVVTVCNMRSLFPKIENFKTDFFERQVDVSLYCEVFN